MTTLPQTISARPRPAQSVSAVPAVASPMVMPVPLQYQQGQQGLSGADIWRVFRQNMWLFLLVFVASVAAGFGLNEYLKRNHLAYTATGKVLVQPPARYDPTGTVVLDEMGRDIDLKIILSNQVQQLTNELLLTEILLDANSVTRQSPWLQREASRGGRFDQARALELLQDSFSARAVEGSSIINVSMTAGEPTEARRILEDIVNRRIEQVRDFGTRGTSTKTDALLALAGKQEQSISRMETEIRNLVSNMTDDSDAGDGTALRFRAMEITRDQQQAQDELMRAQAQLLATQEASRNGETVPEVEMRVAADPSVASLRQQVDMGEIELEFARQSYGENNREFKDLQSRLDIMRDRLADREAVARARYTADVLSILTGTVASADANARALGNQLQELNTTLTLVGQTRAQIDSKREELRSARESLNDMNEQIAVLQATVQQQPDEQLDWAAKPVNPTGPSFPRLPLTVAACLLLGLGLAVGIAFLREVLDTSVKSPRDIARVGHMNVLGMIPDERQDPQAGDPLELTIANAPHSMTAEQFRLMRARLGHLAPLETTRTILVTSPQPGDGKTTVACNLAAGMALNGRKILLVDANFRKPGVHSVFGIANERGLSECLANVEAFDELVQETKVPNLSVLPAGPRPENPAELIEGSSFTDVVDRALEEYDHLIFDSGPILFVSETGALAPQCDGVISVVRARRSTRGLLGRLRDQLRSLNVEHLGVVLNAVRHHAGGYYNRNIKTYYAYQSNGRR